MLHYVFPSRESSVGNSSGKWCYCYFEPSMGNIGHCWVFSFSSVQRTTSIWTRLLKDHINGFYFIPWLKMDVWTELPCQLQHWVKVLRYSHSHEQLKLWKEEMDIQQCYSTRACLWHGHSFSYEGALRTEHVLTWCVSGSKWSKR
jgi:hypothetical protein